MKIKKKSEPPVKKKKMVLFHQVEIGASIIHQGQLLKKYAPKNAMSPRGQTHIISDATFVEIPDESQAQQAESQQG